MKLRRCPALVAGAVVMSAVTSGYAGDVYTSGFEAPTYALGPLAGQDGWLAGASAVVQNAVVLTGAQAGAVGPTHVAQHSWPGRTGLVEVSLDVQFSSAGVASAYSFVLFGNAGFAAAIFVDASGAVKADPGGVDTGVVLPRDTWSNWRMLCDVPNQTFCVIIDGVQVLSDLPIGGNQSELNTTYFGQDIGAAGSDTAYFDNFRVSSPTAYGAGFEAPTFAVGGLVGQDGWTGGGTTANMNIQGAVANTGAQAVQFDATGTSGGSFAARSAAASGVVSISCDVRFASAAAHSQWRIYAIGDAGFLGGPAFMADGSVRYLGASQADTGFDITRDIWHHLEIQYDFNTQLFCFWIDGELLAQNISFHPGGAGSTALDRGQLECATPASDAILFDNFVIAQQTGDEIVDAITMCNDFYVGKTTDNSGTTGDDTSCAFNDTIDEWLLWTAPDCWGTATATTCNPGSDFDTVLTVFDACGGTELACNDDQSGGFDPACDTLAFGVNRGSTLTWNTTPGQRYMIRVSGFNGASGNYDLTIDTAPCVGDLNCDGVVNVTDLLAMLTAWGPNPGHPADLDGDGNVNVIDLLLMLTFWGAC